MIADDEQAQTSEDRDTHEDAFGDDDMQTLDDLDPAGAHPDGRDSSSSAAERVGESDG